MTDTSSSSPTDAYLAKPYHIWLVRDESGGPAQWVAGVEELTGCLTQADTAEEAIEMIHEAMRLWIEVALEDGDRIPEPRPDGTAHSGKFQVRLPASLHGKLVREAEHEGVSLNQFITGVLAAAVNWKGSPDSTRQGLSADADGERMPRRRAG